MSHQEILEKAIQKAIDGGWEPLNVIKGRTVEIHKFQNGGMVEVAILGDIRESPISWVRELEGIIFNHDFAKALWGEEEVWHDGDIPSETWLPNWQHHLSLMVIADDPIEYLGENI